LDRDFSLTALQACDLREYLVNDILVKSDRQSMAHGLEVRAPFLEHDLAAWCFAQPDSSKIGRRGELKALLRAAARKVYGSQIADRPKQGFSIPIHKWVRGPLGPVIKDLLSEESIKRVGVLDNTEVSRVVQDHFSGRRSYGFELWGLAVFVQWHRLRIQQRPADSPALPLINRVFPLS
jgi:asparagine synthase (glutamine-hydrolysing)